MTSLALFSGHARERSLMTELTLYSMPSSGNSYKVRLLLALLGTNYAHVACEANSQELQDAKDAGHLPLGKLPALHLPDGSVLTESGAILWRLAAGSQFLPTDATFQARILEWMFFEQNRLEPVIAVRASLNCYPHLADQAMPEKMDALLKSGNELLGLLDNHLTGRDWLAAPFPTIADIAVYGYVHSSGSRGGYDMSNFPSISEWCARIADLSGYVTLDHLP